MRALYLDPFGATMSVEEPALEATTERHKLELKPQPLHERGGPIEILGRDTRWQGLILEMHTGWAGRHRLKLARQALGLGRRVWLYWPEEIAVECVDRERFQSHRRHWYFITLGFTMRRIAAFPPRVLGRLAARLPSPFNRLIPKRFHPVETSASE